VKKTKPTKNARTARSADKHILYLEAVQTPEADVSFIRRTYRGLRGREPLSLREDFCGTALLCSEWVKSSSERVAFGVDLDAKVQDWGREHNLGPLGAKAERIVLFTGDVLHTRTPKVDVNVAFNFSYWVFKTRPLMVDYFRAVRRHLKNDGLFFLDMHGGYQSMNVLTERRRKHGFTYVWEHLSFDIVSHDMRCAISFEFPDGTRMKHAFTYEWRLWSLPEIRELLLEAGFSAVNCYFEGTARGKTSGNGVYSLKERCANDPCWLAYVVAAP